MEFKGTKGEWKVCEHSWSDTSIICGDKTICTNSIYDEATEESQEELEAIETLNFKLIAAAPDLLEALQLCIKSMYLADETEFNGEINTAKKAIEKALK